MEEIVRSTGSENAGSVESTDDEHGYRWMVIGDPDFEDLVVGVNAVSNEIQGGGYGDRILAAVFAFRDEQGRKPLYWIYNYKRGAFYPFVPSGGEQQRDNERELRLKAQIGQDLPVEPELDALVPALGHSDLGRSTHLRRGWRDNREDAVDGDHGRRRDRDQVDDAVRRQGHEPVRRRRPRRAT